MDSYETLNYCSSSKFDRKGKFGILGDLTNDSCNLDKDEIQSTKPLKYYTQNFYDKDIIQNRGIFFNDGFGVPSCKIDVSSQARVGANTNPNLIQNYDALPLPTTASYVKGQGPVEVEDSIRYISSRETKACQPRDTHFYDRHFYVFEGLPITPNACVDNVVQKGPGYRQGVDTRHTLKTSYRLGPK